MEHDTLTRAELYRARDQGAPNGDAGAVGTKSVGAATCRRCGKPLTGRSTAWCSATCRNRRPRSGGRRRGVKRKRSSVAAAETATLLSPNGDTAQPTHETQVRPLAPLRSEPPKLREASSVVQTAALVDVVNVFLDAGAVITARVGGVELHARRP